MPFNGSGTFERVPGTRIPNEGPLDSAQVNDETDNLVDGINGKVSLSGQLPMTGLQTLSGAGTAALHGATVRQAQSQTLSKAASVGGTVDAITVVMAPVTVAYAAGDVVRWTSGGVNTVTNPTLNRDSLGAKTIKKGASAALVAGDTGVSGYLNEAIYNGTDFILQNPASVASVPTAASTTEVLTGTDTAKFVTPDSNAALWELGSDIASAGTIAIGEGGSFHVTGTTTITDIDPSTDKAGRAFALIHAGIHVLTHSAGTMPLLGGTNITTAVGDISHWLSQGSDFVRMTGYSRADGTSLVSGGGLAAASQAEQEAASSTSVGVTPGRQHFHPSAAKFWVKATANSTTMTASYNMTSWADTGVGVATGTIATDFSSTDWSGLVTVSGVFSGTVCQMAGFQSSAGPTAGTFEVDNIATNDDAATIVLGDPVTWHVVGFGDQ